MINIRRGLFETNSSSVHSVTLLTEQEFSQWKSGKTVDMRNNKIVANTSEKKYGYYTYDEFIDYVEDMGYNYEFEKVEKDGQTFVLVTYYGYA